MHRGTCESIFCKFLKFYLILNYESVTASYILSFEMKSAYPSQVLCNPDVALLALLYNKPSTFADT